MKNDKITIGRMREKEAEEKEAEKKGAMCGGLFALGVVAICAALVIPMARKPMPDKEAVAAMSGSVCEEKERQVLVEAEKEVSAEEEWSIFEYIGEVFADLITGNK